MKIHLHGSDAFPKHAFLLSVLYTCMWNIRHLLHFHFYCIAIVKRHSSLVFLAGDVRVGSSELATIWAFLTILETLVRGNLAAAMAMKAKIAQRQQKRPYFHRTPYFFYVIDATRDELYNLPDNIFFRRMRMPMHIFQELVKVFEHTVTPRGANFFGVLHVAHIVGIGVEKLATGASYFSVGQRFRVSESKVWFAF